MGFLDSLPAARPEEIPQATQAPAQAAVVVVPDQPAPPVQATTQDEFMQRVSQALQKLGINPQTIKDELPHLLLAELEAAAAGAQNAKIPSDAGLWRSIGLRVIAALHAL